MKLINLKFLVLVLIRETFETKRHHDIHSFMDVYDLQYHFGVTENSRVPLYDLTTPAYHESHRDFVQYSADPGWIYPARIEFSLSAFGTQYDVYATRNDDLVAPEFEVTYYGESKDGRRKVEIPASQLRRHYTVAARPVTAEFDEDLVQNGAMSFSEDGITGLFQGKERLLRIVPVRKSVREKYAEAFDVKEGPEKAAQNFGTHVVFEVSRSLGETSAYQFQAQNRKRKTGKGGKYTGIRASVRMGLVADYSVYRTFVDWGFTKDSHQIYFVLAYYNEVQLMYREKQLKKSVMLRIAVQTVGIFTQPQNDLGADTHALTYIKNICEGPYNSESLDHLQAMTWTDIYDKKRKRREVEFALPQPQKLREMPGYRPKTSDPNAIAEAKKAYDTIGLAWIGSTCNKRRHCSVVEMNSPIASFSGAHELGHSLGMKHEEEMGCPFDPKDRDRSSFMSAMSWASNAWATRGKMPQLTDCAIKMLVDSLRGSVKCLVKKQMDKTVPNLVFRNVFTTTMLRDPMEPTELCKVLMGQLWLTFKKWRPEQIHKIFAPETETGHEMCRSLDCKIIGADNTKVAYGFKFGPALPGTICSPDRQKVCYNYRCRTLVSLQRQKNG